MNSNYEQQHADSVCRLVNRLGEENRRTIEEMYQQERALLERNATVQTHIPVLLENIIKRKFTERQPVSS